MRLESALSLALFFGVGARPFGSPEPYLSPVSLPYISEHIIYWFHRACLFMRPSHVNCTDGDVAHHSDRLTSSGLSWQVGSGLFGPFGWGENDVTVVDRNPPVSYASRTAAFGPRITQTPGLLGYVIPLSSFMHPCNQDVTIPSRLPRLTMVEPEPVNFGCPDLCPFRTDQHPDQSEAWIALVQRGNCSFTAKVREAARLGARAVVVGGSPNNAEGDELITMYSPDPSGDISIPATYITHASYTSLLSTIEASNTTISGLKTVSLLLSSDEIWQWPLLTLSILLLLPSIMTLTTLLIHRIRQARAERLERAPEDIVNSLPSGIWTSDGLEFDDVRKGVKVVTHNSRVPLGDETVPAVISEEDIIGFHRGTPVQKVEGAQDDEAQLNKAQLDAITAPSPAEGRAEASATAATKRMPLGQRLTPVDGFGRRYLKKAWFSAQSECAICLSDFERGDMVRILPCGHIFHRDEVDSWLTQRKKLCPVCKADITIASKPPSLRSPSPARLASVPLPIGDAEDSDQMTSSLASSPVASTPNPSPNERTPLLNQQS
ncbi:uncharacterized protein EI90DRAFT_1178055 [Cantharellus anzutake]|uniref:uncharacterized protein n=1 Tax=Cantharellus anzutake TaxID=1750568 RepID=UPI001907FCD9|nr:uncharacterized protein EI90DRAFT_1178055 [Cantharellus anzutake]KAF8330325.1 hypothetical protein EI90DRAFT_1178055 [Cantharellus anzutake]